MQNKRGENLLENVIFISLNLAFLVIIILFIIRQGSGVNAIEDMYAKQIALLIDSGKPGMVMQLNMQDARETAERKGRSFDKIININNDLSLVTVDIAGKGGKSYSYFNDVEVSYYTNEDFYFIVLNKKK